MVENVKRIFSIGRTLYGFLFVVLLPTAIIFWANRIDEIVNLPELNAPVLGFPLLVVGAGLFVAGIIATYRFGKGLPMNAYPPERYVSKGIYRFLSHPMYVGVCLISIGVSITQGSAAGLWLVSPALMLGCTALVLGYENEDLRRRFGKNIKTALISLPPATSAKPTNWNRLSIYLLVILPWIVVYESFVFLGIPLDAINAFLPFEEGLPVYEWTEAIYASTYLLVLVAPLVALKQYQLREFAISGLVATAAIAILFFVVPVIAPPRPFNPTTALGQLLQWERAMDSPAAALPSFHVVWALIAATLYVRVAPKLRLLWYGWAIAIAISCITTGMHAAIDVAAGLAVFLIVRNRKTLWLLVLRLAERVANSWQEWRVGPLRLINHGFYAGAGMFAGLPIVRILTDKAGIDVLLVVTFCSLIVGDLLAQWIEGSSRLLRPFGYYGAILGGVIGIGISGLTMDAPFWEIMAAIAVATPFIQAIGRLRCLVQGCCHGRKAPSGTPGICYSHEKSRVTRIADLSGQSLYPTPVFSMFFNLVLGTVLIRLWYLSVPLSFITGIYFLLSGLGRFVEESYRGEPQTPQFAGLPFYQWLAITSIIVGALITCMNSSASSIVVSDWNWGIFVPGLVAGLIATIAMGVDFPNSDRRFARLSS